MSFKTLIVDGDWNLKRNYSARDILSINGEHCGGVFGFLENLGMIINKTLPDRVVVVWDGDMSGKLRHDFYPLYKNSHKSWDEETYYKTIQEINDEEKRKISISNQKRKLKNIFENLFIRQVEVEYIEGDDLIAQYVLTKEPKESIIIYSRDQDYYQLIDTDVSVLRPADGILLTEKNFKKLLGYTHKNCLLLKCFKGDPSDEISGVPGIGIKTLLDYFPLLKEEEYTVDRIISEAVALYNSQKKKHKTLEPIMGSRSIINRNWKLMDLKNPFLNEGAIKEIELIRFSVLAKEDGFVDRSVHEAAKQMISEGYQKYMYKNSIDNFLSPYYRISAKEKEYTKKMLES
jgi:DNA polymerase-1